MINEEQITWQILPQKVIRKNTSDFSNVITQVQANLRGDYDSYKGIVSFTVDMHLPSVDNFIEYENLTTENLVSFINDTMSIDDMDRLKDKVILEINALAGNDSHIEEIHWDKV